MLNSTTDVHKGSVHGSLTLRSFDKLLLLPPVAALLLFAAGNHNFGFDTPGWLDTFVYVGYFWHYPEHLDIFDNYYKASRLPWVLPGFVAHRLFGEIAGSYLLHWITLSGGGLAMYLLVRDALKDRTIAAVLAVAWVCSTSGHGVGGWNYHMLAAAGYYLAACWLVVRMGTTPSRAAAILSGVALACAVHAHLFYLVFVPLLLILYFAALPRPRDHLWARFARDAAWATTGALALTVLLGAVNAATGGVWLFFMPQVRYTIWISEAGNNSWRFELGTWLPTATYLVIPLLCLVGGAVALLRRTTDEIDRFRTVFVIQGWVALGILSYYQFVDRQSVLDHDYMAFGIYCHAFPAFAAMMSRTRSTSPRLQAAILTASVTLILGALLLGMPASVQSVLNPWATSIDPGLPRVVVPLVAGLTGLLLVSLIPQRAAVVAFALWFSVMNVWAAPATRSYGIHTPGIQRSMLELFRRADRFTSELDPSINGIEYWFAPELVQTTQGVVDLAAVFDSYVSTRGWSGNLLLMKSPGVPLDQLGPAQLDGVTCIGVLSSIDGHESVRMKLVSRFQDTARPLIKIAERRFTTDDLSFALTVFKPASEKVRVAASGTGSTRFPCQP